MKKIIITLMIISLFAVFTACSNNGNIDSKIISYTVACAESGNEISELFEEASNDGGNFCDAEIAVDDAYLNGVLAAKINSMQELIAFSDNYEFPFFDEEAISYNSSLSQQVRGYGDFDFQEKSLIIVAFCFTHTYIPAVIDSIETKGETINITIARPDEVYVAEAETPHFFIVELNKEAVEGINIINPRIIAKGKQADYTDN